MNARVWTCLLLSLSTFVPPALAKDKPRDRPPAPEEELGDALAGLARTLGKEKREDPCHLAEEALGRALADLAITAGGHTQPIVAVRVRGLQAVDEEALWTHLGGTSVLPMDAPAAAGIVLRLRWTGLFARVTPSLVVDDAGTTLDVAVEENPVVRRVTVEGLVENEAGPVQGALLDVPDPGETCGRPPLEWLARVEGGEVHPGVLWGGLSGAGERALRRLHKAGYRMATVDPRMRGDGTLAATIDEGRLESVEIRGVDAAIVGDVRRTFALTEGSVYVESDGRGGIERVRRRFPFVTAGELDVEGRKLVVNLRTAGHMLSLSADEAEILRHTRHAGYSPGLTMHYWDFDPRDRFRLLLAGQANWSVSHGDLEWLVGPRLQLPRLGIAELGVQAHDFADTADRWRMSRVDSYLDSLFGSGRRTDYYRRKGWSAFATAHVDERLTAGVEYRRDRHGVPRAPLDPGTQGSLVLRGEWSSTRAEMKEVGTLYRHTETSIVRRRHRARMVTGFDTVNTVEIANTSLGSEPGTDFVRVISDSTLTLATGRRSGLRLRARYGAGDRVPLRQQEALGGWSALRGYRHKELRGERSWLGTAEYRLDKIWVFADVGSVRQAGVWTDPKVGLGAKLHLGDEVFVSAAWRADGAERRPLDIRLFFKQAF